jgi:hypothetical protein
LHNLTRRFPLAWESGRDITVRRRHARTDITTTILTPVHLTATTDRSGSWVASSSAQGRGSTAGAAGDIMAGVGVMKAGAVESAQDGDAAIMAVASQGAVLLAGDLPAEVTLAADSRATAMRDGDLPAELMVDFTVEAASMVEAVSTEAADFMAAVADSTVVAVTAAAVIGK